MRSKSRMGVTDRFLKGTRAPSEKLKSVARGASKNGIGKESKCSGTNKKGTEKCVARTKKGYYVCLKIND